MKNKTNEARLNPDPGDKNDRMIHLLEEILSNLKAMVYYVTPSRGVGPGSRAEAALGTAFMSEGLNKLIEEELEALLKEDGSEEWLENEKE
jgi:hypothetical protein